jgi:hypothetical protein
MPGDVPDNLPSIDGQEANSNAARLEVRSRVERGEMTLADAEQWAKKLGLQPFAMRPATSTFDPMSVQWWTPLQTAVWIAYHDVEEVRNVSTEFRQHWPVWRAVHTPASRELLRRGSKEYRRGWQIGQARPASFDSFADPDERILEGLFPRDEQSSNADLDKIEQARAELRQALMAGKVRATGIVDGGRRRGVVLSMEWINLTFALNAADVVHHQQGLAYTAVRIDRAAIVKQWPVITPDGAAVLAAFREYVKTNGPPITQRQAVKIAKDIGAKLPRIAVIKLVNVPEFKGKQGRRKKTP